MTLFLIIFPNGEQENTVSNNYLTTSKFFENKKNFNITYLRKIFSKFKSKSMEGNTIRKWYSDKILQKN